MLDPRDDSLLQDLLDGRLAAADAERVRARLAAEPALAEAWEEIRRLRELLRADLGAPPADFLARVKAAAARPEVDPALNGEAARPSPSAQDPAPAQTLDLPPAAARVPLARPRVFRAVAFAYGAAAVVVVGLVATFLLTTQSFSPREAAGPIENARQPADARIAEASEPPEPSGTFASTRTSDAGASPAEVPVADVPGGEAADAAPASVPALEEKAPGLVGPVDSRPRKPSARDTHGDVNGKGRSAAPGSFGPWRPPATPPSPATVYLLTSTSLDVGRAEVGLIVAALRVPPGGLADEVETSALGADALESSEADRAKKDKEARDAAGEGLPVPEATPLPALERLCRLREVIGGRAELAAPDAPSAAVPSGGDGSLEIDVDLTPEQAQRLAGLVASVEADCALVERVARSEAEAGSEAEGSEAGVERETPGERSHPSGGAGKPSSPPVEDPSRAPGYKTAEDEVPAAADSLPPAQRPAPPASGSGATGGGGGGAAAPGAQPPAGPAAAPATPTAPTMPPRGTPPQGMPAPTMPPPAIPPPPVAAPPVPAPKVPAPQVPAPTTPALPAPEPVPDAEAAKSPARPSPPGAVRIRFRILRQP